MAKHLSPHPMKLDPKRTARYYYLKFIRLKGEPCVLARGIAIGTFIGITPTIPFHSVMALALAFLLRGSKVAALLATFVVSNPLTFFPQYYLSWHIGNRLLPGKHSWGDVSELINLVVNGRAIQRDPGRLQPCGHEFPHCAHRGRHSPCHTFQHSLLLFVI